MLSKRIAKKKYVQLLREYERAKEELYSMYNTLLQLRELAGMDDERPIAFAEPPDLDPGIRIYKNW